MDHIYITNAKTKMQDLFSALRHRYVLMCELHLHCERATEKALKEGDGNMAAYWYHQAEKEWAKAERIRLVIKDLEEDLGR